MVRPLYFDSNGIKKGVWSEEEDNMLRAHVQEKGHDNWRLVPYLAGLNRCGKSCRLRWLNYLKPGVRRGNFSKQEKDLIIQLHAKIGNRWSAIAEKFPGRTDNDIKNYWNAHIKRKRGIQSHAAEKVKRRAQVPQEKKPPEITNHGFTNNHQVESVHNIENPENRQAGDPIGFDPYFVAQVKGDVCNEIACADQTRVSLRIDLSEVNDSGFCQNGISTFSDSSSDSGIANSWNSTPVESQEDFWSELLEEDIVDMALLSSLI